MASIWKKLAATVVIAIGLQSTVIASATPMPTFQISYILENKYIVGGKAKLSLQTDNEQYQLTLETQPTGVFRFSDKGKIREEATLPTLTPPYLADTYTYTNFGDNKRSYTSAYNRQQSQATMTQGGKEQQFDIDPNGIDRLSTTLTIMQLLIDNPDVKEFSIPTIDRNKLQTVEYISQGQEKLNTKLGQVDAIRIDRKRNNSNRHIVTWFAAVGAQQLLVPVRIEQYKNGKLSIRLKIEGFSING